MLHECVAQGAITEIWLATDKFENVVAVRRLRRSGLKHSSAPKLFKAGLKVQRKLAPHTNIIRFINHGKAEGLPFMVLEYIQGADLKLVISRNQNLIDNIADVLSVSPMLVSRYLSAARKISQRAIGDPSLRPDVHTYEISKPQNQHTLILVDYSPEYHCASFIPLF